MAGAKVSITIDDERVKTALAALAKRAHSLRPAFEEFGAYEVSSTQQRFERERDPAGAAWPKLGLSTQLQPTGRSGKRRGGDHILRDRGLLVQSLAYLASDATLAVGSNRKYAAIHQLGGTADMAPGAAGVPARPYLGLSHEDADELGVILLEHLGGAIP